MGSAIWKLSALATVVGLGMVGVVVQQKGLGLGSSKPGATAAGDAKGTAAPPVPKVPGAGKTPSPEKVAENASDPFGTESPSDTTGGPPEQTGPSDTTPTLAEDGPPENSITGTETTESAGQTAPRTRTRGLNFKDQVLADSGPPADAGQFGEGTSGDQSETGSRSASAQNLDPAEMEGTTAGDNPTTDSTDEERFPGRPQPNTPGQGARTRGRGPARNDTFAGQTPDAANAADPIGEFGPDQNAEAQGQPIPRVPGAGGSAGRPSGNAGSFRAQPVENVVNDVEDGQRGAAPAGYQAQVPQGGKAQSGLPKGRPSMLRDEDDGIKSGQRTAPPRPPGVAAPPVPKTGNLQQRPKSSLVDEEEDAPASRPPAPGAVKSPATTPKLINGADAAPTQSMPPSVSKSAGTRPKGFDDEDEGLGATPGRPQPAPPSSTPSPTTDRTQTNPRGPADTSEFDNPLPPAGTPRPRGPSGLQDDETPLTGTPDAAASRSTVTDVRVSPQQSGATGGYPGTSPRAAGRGRVMIEKSAPTTAYVGQPFVYTLKVRNTGNASAQQVIVEDELPEGVAMQGSTLQAEMTGRKLAWKIGSLAAGEEKKISVKVVPGKAGATGTAARVKFMAEQRYASADGPDAGMNTAPRTTSRTSTRTSTRSRSNTAATPGGRIEMEMEAPPDIVTGRSFELRFRVTNRSNQPATDLLVINTLPNGVRDASGVPALQYELKSLAPGESREMPLTLMARQPGPKSCHVEIQVKDTLAVLYSNDFAFEVGGNAIAATGQTRPSLGVDLVQPDGPVALGGRASYEIRLTNRGTAPVRQSIVRLTVPAELRLANVSPQSYRQEGADLVFEPIPSLEAGQQAVVKADFIAQSAGDTFVKIQTTAAHMKRPLSREEGLTISGN